MSERLVAGSTIARKARARTVLGVFAGVCLFFSPAVSDASGMDRMRAPRAKVHKAKAAKTKHPRGGAVRDLVRFFRTNISKVDGNRCPMYPTCSQYAEQALAKHGAIVGLLLFVDRLFHEWSETSIAPSVWVYGVERYWDPLEENDFWFAGKKTNPSFGPHDRMSQEANVLLPPLPLPRSE